MSKKEKKKTGCGGIIIICLVGLVAYAMMQSAGSEKAPKPQISAEEQAAIDDSHQAGFDDGWLVGKAAAWDGKNRDGARAMRLGRIHAESHSGDQDAYARGYRSGYNHGWHAAVEAGAEIQD